MNAREAVLARKNTRGDGTSSAKDANADRQFRCALGGHKQHPVVSDESNEYVFYWLRCRGAQGQFRYYWMPGVQNLADYFTKKSRVRTTK